VVVVLFIGLFYLFFKRFYLFERESVHEYGEQAGGEGEAGCPLSGEPKVGLYPRTLRS